MTEREAFEAWARAESSGAPDFSSAAALWSFAAWQASRKQALEEAADMVHKGGNFRMALAIRSLTPPGEAA